MVNILDISLSKLRFSLLTPEALEIEVLEFWLCAHQPLRDMESKGEIQ